MLRNHAFWLLVLSAPALAQTTFTAPLSHATAEGDDWLSNLTPFRYTACRYQFVYGSMRGTPRPNINKLQMRRDGLLPASAQYAARTLTLGVVMAHADFSLLGDQFLRNYKGSPATVFTPKQVSLPTHENPPVAPPAAWTVSVPFDTQWSYNGTDDLLVEMTGANSTNITGGYLIDAAAFLALGQGSFAELDTNDACLTPNGRFLNAARAPQSDPSHMVALTTFATGGPSTSPAAIAVGISDPNVPLYCSKLRTNANLVLPLMTSSTGGIASAAAPLRFRFPYPGPLDVYIQYVAVGGTTIYLSDGIRHSPVPGNVSRFGRIYANNTSTTATIATDQGAFAPVILFTY